MIKRIPGHQTIDYQFPRDNRTWADHRLRVRLTAELIAWLEADSVVDPACGDGSIVMAAQELHPFKRTVMSDLSVPNIDTLRGHGWAATVETAEAALGRVGNVDVIVLTEILEHVEDPVGLLKLARAKGKYLVASSPLWDGETLDHNPEHLWMFTAAGFAANLEMAGWEPVTMVPLYFTTVYDFQLWVAK